MLRVRIFRGTWSQNDKLLIADDILHGLKGKPLTGIAGSDPDVGTFYVHEDIASHSDLLAAPLRNGWKEPEEHIVQLLEENAARFEMSARFVCTGIVCSKGDGDDHDQIPEW